MFAYLYLLFQDDGVASFLKTNKFVEVKWSILDLYHVSSLSRAALKIRGCLAESTCSCLTLSVLKGTNIQQKVMSVPKLYIAWSSRFLHILIFSILNYFS